MKSSITDLSIERRKREIEHLYKFLDFEALSGRITLPADAPCLKSKYDIEFYEIVDDIEALLQQPKLREVTLKRLRSVLESIAKDTI